MACATALRGTHRSANAAARVRQLLLPVAASSLLPYAPVSAVALDWVTQPSRLEQAITVECGGLTGRIVIEERFVRRPMPRSQVKLTRVVPLGAGKPVLAGRSLTALFDRMMRIDRLSWFCAENRATVIIRYVDQAAWEDFMSALDARKDAQRPGTMRVVLHLTRTGLVAEGPPHADVE